MTAQFPMNKETLTVELLYLVEERETPKSLRFQHIINKEIREKANENYKT